MSNNEIISLEGKWNLVVKSPTGKRPSTLVIEGSGDTLTGTLASQTGDITAISDVKVDGSKVSWVNEVTKPMNLKVVFTGEIDGNNISGKAKIGFMGSYPFTAVRE